MAKNEAVDELKQAMREYSTLTIRLHQAVAQRLGLNGTDHKALDIIVQSDPMTAGELAVELQVTTGAVTGILDRLEKANFITRVRHAHDGRRVIIQPAADAAERVLLVLETVSGGVDAITAGYSADDLAVLRDFFDRSNTLVSRYLGIRESN